MQSNLKQLIADVIHLLDNDSNVFIKLKELEKIHGNVIRDILTEVKRNSIPGGTTSTIGYFLHAVDTDILKQRVYTKLISYERDRKLSLMNI